MKVSEIAKRMTIPHTKVKRYTREFLGPDAQATKRSGHARDLNVSQAHTLFLGGYLVSTLEYTVFQARQIMDDLSGFFEEKGLLPESSPNYAALGLVGIVLEIFPVEGGCFYYLVREIISSHQDPKDPTCLVDKYREYSLWPKNSGSSIKFNQFNSRVINISILLELFRAEFSDIRGPSKRPRSADFLNNVLCIPYVTS